MRSASLHGEAHTYTRTTASNTEETTRPARIVYKYVCLRASLCIRTSIRHRHMRAHVNMPLSGLGHSAHVCTHAHLYRWMRRGKTRLQHPTKRCAQVLSSSRTNNTHTDIAHRSAVCWNSSTRLRRGDERVLLRTRGVKLDSLGCPRLVRDSNRDQRPKLKACNRELSGSMARVRGSVIAAGVSTTTNGAA